MIPEKVIMAYLKLLFLHLPGGSKESWSHIFKLPFCYRRQISAIDLRERISAASSFIHFPVISFQKVNLSLCLSITP